MQQIRSSSTSTSKHVAKWSTLLCISPSQLPSSSSSSSPCVCDVSLWCSGKVQKAYPPNCGDKTKTSANVISSSNNCHWRVLWLAGWLVGWLASSASIPDRFHSLSFSLSFSSATNSPKLPAAAVCANWVCLYGTNTLSYSHTTHQSLFEVCVCVCGN